MEESRRNSIRGRATRLVEFGLYRPASISYSLDEVENIAFHRLPRLEMNHHIFTILAVFAVLFAAVVAVFNLMLSAYIVGGVLAFGVGLLIYRIKFGS